jgi:aminoglycoside/choline kinase family phosphotransferase
LAPVPERSDARDAFLHRHGRADWARALLAGDASNRRYDRLCDPATGRSEILMDAPPERGEDTGRFVAIARHLRAIGLAAPEILAEDGTQGFLLIEDFGDAVFARVLERAPDREADLYRAAADVLLHLHRHAPPAGVPRFAVPMDTEFLTLAWAWYRHDSTGALPDEARGAADLLNRLLADHADAQNVLILRDYHAENLVLRPGLDGISAVGLLDFQDAMAGHPAYDLISLLADARRDVSDATRVQTVDHVLRHGDHEPETFRTALAVLGAQRNLRILGVFARLCLAHGKTRYVDLIPRVWAHLMRDLDHPALAPLRSRVLSDLPPPDPRHLQEMKARCARVPMP